MSLSSPSLPSSSSPSLPSSTSSASASSSSSTMTKTLCLELIPTAFQPDELFLQGVRSTLRLKRPCSFPLRQQSLEQQQQQQEVPFDAMIHLGRNHDTRIADASVSRFLASVWVKTSSDNNNNFFAWLKILKPSHLIHVNGHRIYGEVEMELKHGDILSLYDNRYSYQVHLFMETKTTTTTLQVLSEVAAAATNKNINNDDDNDKDTTIPDTPLTRAAETSSNVHNNNMENDNTAPEITEAAQEAAMPPSTGVSSSVVEETSTPPEPQEKEEKKKEVTSSCPKVQQVRQEAQEQSVAEVICPICMDILAHSVVCNPCGHVFCRDCFTSCCRRGRSTFGGSAAAAVCLCPTCRSPVLHRTPVPTMDNLIFNMALRGDFNQDDAQQYLQRTNRNVTEEEKESILSKKSPKLDDDIVLNLVRKRKPEVDPNDDQRRPPPPPPPSQLVPFGAPWQNPFLFVVDLSATSSSSSSSRSPQSGLSERGTTIDDAICID